MDHNRTIEKIFNGLRGAKKVRVKLEDWNDDSLDYIPMKVCACFLSHEMDTRRDTNNLTKTQYPGSNKIYRGKRSNFATIKKEKSSQESFAMSPKSHYYPFCGYTQQSPFSPFSPQNSFAMKRDAPQSPYLMPNNLSNSFSNYGNNNNNNNKNGSNWNQMKQTQLIGMKKEQSSNNRSNNSNENDYKFSNGCNLINAKVSSLNGINQTQLQSINILQSSENESNSVRMPQLSQLTQLTQLTYQNNNNSNSKNIFDNNKEKYRKKRKFESKIYKNDSLQGGDSPIELNLPFLSDNTSDSDLEQDIDIVDLTNRVASSVFVCIFPSFC